MKTLTVQQPHASLIVEGFQARGLQVFKDIENRTWKTNYRGRMLIHASAKSWPWKRFINYIFNRVPYAYKIFPYEKHWLGSLTTGAIIGSVELVDCVLNHPSIWAEDTETDPLKTHMFGVFQTWNWVLANPILFDKPIPAKGALGLWEYTGEIPENSVL